MPQLLEKLGLKLNHQRMSVIFKNPFYCGLMAHNALEGKLIEGSHEKLISKELFLKVNEIQSHNPHGFKQCPEPDGIYYDRKNDAVRTENINPLFLWMAQQAQVLSNKKSGIPELNLSYAALVAYPMGWIYRTF